MTYKYGDIIPQTPEQMALTKQFAEQLNLARNAYHEAGRNYAQVNQHMFDRLREAGIIPDGVSPAVDPDGTLRYVGVQK